MINKSISITLISISENNANKYEVKIRFNLNSKIKLRKSNCASERNGINTKNRHKYSKFILNYYHFFIFVN